MYKITAPHAKFIPQLIHLRLIIQNRKNWKRNHTYVLVYEPFHLVYDGFRFVVKFQRNQIRSLKFTNTAFVWHFFQIVLSLSTRVKSTFHRIIINWNKPFLVCPNRINWFEMCHYFDITCRSKRRKATDANVRRNASLCFVCLCVFYAAQVKFLSQYSVY